MGVTKQSGKDPTTGSEISHLKGRGILGLIWKACIDGKIGKLKKKGGD